MINYTIGDKVVCLTDHYTTDRKQTVFKGNIYIVKGMTTCSCGLIAIDIGLSLCENEYTECDCGNKFNDGIWWFHNRRFTKLESKEKVVSDEVEVSEKETINKFMEIFNLV